MTAFSFDTHRVVKELEEAGFSQTQAEAVVSALGSAFSGNLATKADLDLLKAELKAEFKADVAELKAEFKADIGELKTEFKADIGELRNETQNENASIRSEIKSESASLRSELQSLELRMTLRLGAIVVVAAAVATAIARFL